MLFIFAMCLLPFLVESFLSTNRPNPSILAHNNIIEEPKVAPRLQSMAKALDRSMKADTLSRMLNKRSDIDTLKSNHVIPAPGVAPSLRSATLALQQNFTRDNLQHRLQARPDPETLVRGGILPSASMIGGTSSRIAAVQKQLRMQMTADRIAQLLDTRARVSDLHPGVLRDVGVAPRLQGVYHELERNIKRSQLLRALASRKTRDELIERGIYVPVNIPGDTEGEWKLQSELEAEAEAEAALAQQQLEEEQAHMQQQQHQQQQQQYQQQQLRQQQHQQQEDHRAAAAAAAAQSQAQAHAAQQGGAELTGYQRRSKNFHLTRLLLKIVAQMTEAGEVSLPQKGVLKDLIVDQDPTILAIAEHFDTNSDIVDFKDSLARIAQRR